MKCFFLISNSPLMLWLSFFLLIFVLTDFNFRYCTGEMHLHREGKWCLSHLPGNDCFISHYCSNKGSKQTLIKSFNVNGYPLEDDLSRSKTSKKRYRRYLFWLILSRYMPISFTTTFSTFMMLFYVPVSNVQSFL